MKHGVVITGGLSIFTLSERHYGTKKFVSAEHAKLLYFVIKRRKKRKTVRTLVQFGLRIFGVSDTVTLHRVWHQIHAPVILQWKQLYR